MAVFILNKFLIILSELQSISDGEITQSRGNKKMDSPDRKE
jgi:hypothetical protein